MTRGTSSRRQTHRSARWAMAVAALAMSACSSAASVSAPAATVAPSTDGSTPAEASIASTPTTAALRSRYSIPDEVSGLVITGVTPTSRAGRVGLEAGFVILQANGRRLESVDQLQSIIAEAKAANREGVFLLLRIPAGNRPFVLELSKPE